MKKSKIVASLMTAGMIFGMTACGDTKPVSDANPEIVAVYNTYKANAEASGKTPLSYEDWLASIKGDKGDKGDRGDDGVTPHIGTNGNWFIGTTDTGVKATGAAGQNGHTPVITIGANGNWFVDGVDTNKKAQGEKGGNGEDGVTPHIGENGNWFIGETDTGVKAQAESPKSVFDASNYSVGVEDGEYVLKYADADKNMMYGEISRTAVPDSTTAEFDVNLNDNAADAFKFVKGASSTTSYDKGSYETWTRDGDVFTCPRYNGSGAVKGVLTFTVTKAGKIVLKVNGQNEKSWDFIQARINGSLIADLNTAEVYATGENYTITSSIDVAVGDVVKIGWVSDSGHGAKVTLVGAPATPKIATFATYGGASIAPRLIVNGEIDGGLPTPNRDGYYFDGWYSNADFTNKISSAGGFEDNAVLHAHFLPLAKAHFLFGKNMGGYFDGTSFTSSADVTSLNVDYFGNFVVTFKSNYTFSGKFTGYNEATGEILTNTSYKFQYDAAREVIFVYNTSSASASASTLFGVFKKGADSVLSSSFFSQCKVFDSGATRIFTIDGRNYYAKASNKTVYYNVRFQSVINNYGATVNGIDSGDLITTIWNNELSESYDTIGATSSSGYGVVDGAEVGKYKIDNDTNVCISYKEGSNPSVYAYYAPYSETQGWLYGGKMTGDSVAFSITGKANYTFVLDTENMTATVAENKTTITYDWKGHTPEGAATSKTVWNDDNIYPSDLPKVTGNQIVEGESTYVFDGWYFDEDLSTAVSFKKAAGDFTVYAKWLEAKTVTVDTGSGTSTVTVGKGNKVTIADPTAPAGKYFVGWYNGEEAFDIKNTPVTENITLTAKFADLPAFVNNYYKYNIYYAVTAIRSGSSGFYIKSNGSYNLNTTGTVNLVDCYDAATNKITGSNGTVSAFEKDGHFFVFYDTIDNDWYFFAEADGSKAAIVKQYCFGSNPSVWVFNVAYENGDNYSFFANSNGEITNFVTLKNAADEEISFASLYDGEAGSQALVKVCAGENVLKTYGYNGSGYVESDGHAATLEGLFNGVNTTIVLNGYAGVTIGEGEDAVTGTYTFDDEGKCDIVVNGKNYKIAVAEETFMQVLDGYQGTYTSEGNPNLVLTGYYTGTYGDEAITYKASKGTVTVVKEDGTKVLFSVDTTAYTYAEAEAPAFVGKAYGGLTSYTYDVGLVFDEDDGVYVYFGYQDTFKGQASGGNYGKKGTYEFDGESVSITCENGDKFVFTYDGETDTFSGVSQTYTYLGSIAGKKLTLYVVA